MLVKQDQLIEDDHEHVKEMISKLKSYANGNIKIMKACLVDTVELQWLED